MDCDYYAGLIFFRLSDKARLIKSSTPAVSPITTPAKLQTVADNLTPRLVNQGVSHGEVCGQSMEGMEPLEQSDDANVCLTIERTCGESTDNKDRENVKR